MRLPIRSLPLQCTAPTGSMLVGQPAPAGSAGTAEPMAQAGLMGTDPNDDLSLGKKHFRAQISASPNGISAAPSNCRPKDAEAWLGLAASYDRLKRFDLADRAYEEAIGLVGQTPEILNNQGFSYLLRGDHRRARALFVAAQARDPRNPYIKNNLAAGREERAQAQRGGLTVRRSVSVSLSVRQRLCADLLTPDN